MDLISQFWEGLQLCVVESDFEFHFWLFYCFEAKSSTKLQLSSNFTSVEIISLKVCSPPFQFQSWYRLRRRKSLWSSGASKCRATTGFIKTFFNLGVCVKSHYSTVAAAAEVMKSVGGKTRHLHSKCLSKGDPFDET